MNFIVSKPHGYFRGIFEWHPVRLKFIMRACFFYIVLMISSGQLLLAYSSFGQPPEKRMTKIEMRDENFHSLFTKLKAQAGLSFLVSGQIEGYGNINLPLAERSVKEVLDLVLIGTELTYHIKGNTVFIYERDAGKGKTEVSKVSTGILSMFEITGRITDGSTGHPLAGVNIIVKGTTRGTSSDSDGRFSIAAAENETLVFSFIGFKTFETDVAGRSTIDVIMEIEAAALQEVVVNAGYYNVKDREQTGNIAKLDEKDIAKQPVSNPLQALQGRVSGVNIQQFSGLPGGQFSIQIRGRNSINPDIRSEPLYVVDGVPFSSESFGGGFGGIMQNHVSPINSISPSDIESIEILKDADATAIYGSRGANGVVLITTKKGKAGKTSIDANFSCGFGQVGHTMNLLSSSQYLEMKREALENNSSWPVDPSSYSLYPEVFLWDTSRYTDWQKEFIGGTAKVTNARISLSGGAAKTQYLFSGSYYREGSVFPGDFIYQKGSVLSSLTHTSNDEKFKFSSSINYTVDNNELPKDDLTFQAISLAPTAPALFDENGDINWENNTWINPMAAYLKPKYRAAGDNLTANASINYEIIRDLNIKTNLGYNKRFLEQLSTTPYSSARPDRLISFQATSIFGSGGIKTWIAEPQIEYKRSIGKGIITMLVGTSFQETKKTNEVKMASGFTSDALLENIKAATNVRFTLSDFYQYRYTSIFGRFNYSLKDKYILNLTARRDGSSRFGPDNQFGDFGAVGAAWIFSNEGFIKDQFGLLSFGKLRVSYGTTGSDNIGDYKYLDSYGPTQNPYQGTTGLVPTRLANPNYGWETNRKFESAVEIGLVEDMITFSTSFYLNRSSNQLVGYALPAITGQLSVQRNLPATVENTGWEFELNTVNVKGNFSWTTDFNLTAPQNKLVEYPDLENSPYRLVIGKPLNVVQGLRYTGVNPLTGYYTFEDVNADGRLTSDDYQVLGKLGTEFFLGVGNSIKFKGLQLDFHFQAVRQTGYSYIVLFPPPGQLGYNSNQPSLVMGRWTVPGEIREIQKFTTGGNSEYYNQIISDRYMVDASYIRLKNIHLSYQLTGEWINSVKIKSANIYVQGQNLITITNYIGLDPESQNSSRLPPLRTITIGMQMSF
ncbi:TonB-dependent receptor [Fulvivirgaceae bacterium PWU4]|uniref:TonB-dependent receptor n=1 Tax=Chryseosolibacter histidini TaxID=2782349 RepID=A0AAP2DUN1_9BACT|nr:TonB-dependent receptor [Chryseosolibacter histidini]MBT1701292.1 TonB-dependent receptor [Chryseosolibacter histidini]